MFGGMKVLKGTVSRDIDGYFRVYKIKLVLSAGPLMVFTFFTSYCMIHLNIKFVPASVKTLTISIESD
jgi:hypothetical protein